ncbi:arginine biosynthesis protein ArgJ [Dipodascopsis tothii]|uniref:arginine biosynthesis protein ArgJ n=1 Tax=Dipodascopsis tothii TaxID=44089 RepID=UPI0034CFB90D
MQASIVRRAAAAAGAAASKARFVPASGKYPQGFKVGGSHVGVKKSVPKPGHPSCPTPDSLPLDLAVVYSTTAESSAAAVFTQNKFQAAPVVVSRAVLADGGKGVRGMVINSGCANAVTGEGGKRDAEAMVAALDSAVTEATGVATAGAGSLVMSTGVIGQRLPIDRIVGGVAPAVAAAGSGHSDWLAAARAICTTDTFPKLVSEEFTTAAGVPYRIAGLAKGAGMIHPNMATLLGLFATDAAVAAPALRGVLKHAVDRSFNCISVDGDTSTNDTIAIVASGAAGATIPEAGPELAQFQENVTGFARRLAQLVVRDGEGATKFVTIRVEQASTYEAAKTVAAAVAQSALVKTALFGQDANWGRIACAVGYSGVDEVDPLATDVSFIAHGAAAKTGPAELPLLVRGEPENVDETRAAEILAEEDLEIVVRLRTGDAEALFWTCDLSHEYVSINGDYRS